MPFQPDRIVAAELATGNPPNERIEITSQGGHSRIEFYTGDPAETLPGIIDVDVQPAPPAVRTATLDLAGPQLAPNAQTGVLHLISDSTLGAGGGTAQLVGSGAAPAVLTLIGGAVVGTASITAGGATVSVNGDVQISSGGAGTDVSVNATDDITLQAGDDITVTANDAITVGGGGTALFRSTGGAATLSASTTATVSGATATVSATGTATLTGVNANVTSTGGGDVTITGADDVIATAADDMSLTAGDQLSLNSTTGRVVVTGPDFSNNATRSYMNGTQQPVLRTYTAALITGPAGGGGAGTGTSVMNHIDPAAPLGAWVQIGNHQDVAAYVTAIGATTITINFRHPTSNLPWADGTVINCKVLTAYYP